MRSALTAFVCSLLVLGFFAGDVSGKGKPGREADRRLITEFPSEPVYPPEIGSSMFQTADANTTVLGWYQFDTPGGLPTTQGWTTHDMTAQVKSYWHVAGAGCGDAVTPINGARSMWCGQWSSALDPWNCWASLPGYGNSWNQSLESTVSSITSVTYKIRWDSEWGYDFTYPEWYDPSASQWVPDAAANGGAGGYTAAGGPLTENLVSPYGPTKFRFHFVSDWGWSDEDGLNPTAQGASLVDDISINGGAAQTFEAAACDAQTAGLWKATMSPSFGQYGALHFAGYQVQEDPCMRPMSHAWGWFDDPAVTSYACGGWPLQGAVPYGPDENGLYLENEIWSPWIPMVGTGNKFLLEYLVYRDLPLENLMFFRWWVRTRDMTTGGCPPSGWTTDGYWYYGPTKYWSRVVHDFSNIPVVAPGTHLQVSIEVVDMSPYWSGLFGVPTCHTHAPLIDQVKVMRVPAPGPHIGGAPVRMFQDTFPENGDITTTSYARCDIAEDIIESMDSPGMRICPGDSLVLDCSDPLGLADDNTGGRPGKTIYLFVKVTDRFGNPVPGKSGAAIQSPDNQAWSGDPHVGLLRYPYVAGVAPVGWSAYRCDHIFTDNGNTADQAFCADLMDISAYLPAEWHANENAAANVGIFAPGDVIRYFIAAKNLAGEWSYLSRKFDGQGDFFQSNDVNVCAVSPMEWSVLPDAGRLPGEAGDILFVDDADGPPSSFAQPYFDWAFEYLGIADRVDRFDVLWSPASAGNSLASRVKNIQQQLIGAAPNEIYQKVIWNCGNMWFGLMGDGGPLNGGSSSEKSDDFGLCYTFLNNHPSNPGWAYWADGTVQDWATLTGPSAAAVKNVFMNHTFLGNDQRTVTGQISPRVYSVPASPWDTETFSLHGGCPRINDFDMPGASGASSVGHKYNNTASASVYQATPNSVGSTARFFLAGFGFEFIRDDDTDDVPDYATHLWKVLQWMQNVLPAPTGIDPVVYADCLENAYPNPFNPTTTIRYSIASAGRVTLKIYNAAGQLVRTLVDEDQAPTAEGFATTWDGRSDQGEAVASGVYFYKLTTKEFRDTKKMVLLK